VVPGGKLVAAGFGTVGSTGTFALARYRRDGSLDPTFGTGGRVVTDMGAFDSARALVVQDGRLVAAGSTIGVSGVARGSPWPATGEGVTAR
jgi:Domain of unknown function (DUF5122) beta-propeller